MPTIALDAMGCDRGPEVTLEGAAALSREEGAPELLLVGDDAVLRPKLAGLEHDPRRLHLVHAPQVITMEDSPSAALAAKPRASVAVAAELVRSGEADALVSAGNTGAVTLACARAFERLPGVRRCALGSVYPTERRRGAKADPFSLILDVGLTLEATADDLVTFALMGSAYAARISRNPSPRIALLSNGSEAHKGPPAIVEAHRRLAARDDLDFLGNVEGVDIPRGTADVVVTGGFLGNVVLKMLEGVAETVTRLGKYAVEEKLRYKAGFALLAPAMKALRQATDWEQYGGAPILGFDHLCIKAHGRSSARAIRNALKVAHKGVRTELVAGIRETLERCPP
ncbi:MAG TPA: phosphate acyltransferase PlsX [Polyangiaceae bacterium LLY-WYZ-15_(1-7)]|nr:phosphate acyltransferase PlsX [Polyangiaceae bacterium LLY-WYZ-15_(1-7)]HJL01466.1 phosphate acyltransferase PlsX [Polyangiaceae bacterium LLY-WYZ-15_(1-7)]HJL11923.1 phosphate acyltransferase PlsX [Polyangiaceae bacterium LLY-WYZ-15_(1-7)]HJL23521.1 phosphate acyltransferase PlsX [Polyangiaceae bacterium LLY-WYZ-15_(1-7)]HJL34494.1 phosphate acyltransferase PlsX [Polyangiaceae bacterium LLY-WYZ-15_(1-7)]